MDSPSLKLGNSKFTSFAFRCSFERARRRTRSDWSPIVSCFSWERTTKQQGNHRATGQNCPKEQNKNMICDGIGCLVGWSIWHVQEKHCSVGKYLQAKKIQTTHRAAPLEWSAANVSIVSESWSPNQVTESRHITVVDGIQPFETAVYNFTSGKKTTMNSLRWQPKYGNNKLKEFLFSNSSNFTVFPEKNLVSWCLPWRVFPTLARRWKRRLRTKNLRAADWILTASRVRSLGNFHPASSCSRLMADLNSLKVNKHRERRRRMLETNEWLKHRGWKIYAQNAMVFSHFESLFFWFLSIISWLSSWLAETSGNEVGGHAKCVGWSWRPARSGMKVQWTKRCQRLL